VSHVTTRPTLDLFILNFNTNALRRAAPAALALTLAACAAPDSHRQTHRTMAQRPTGTREIARSPLDLDDLAALQGSLLFGEEDVRALRMSLPLVREHADEILDVWYGFVASTPQLVVYFSDAKSGEPDGDYLAAVRERFERWITVTARAEYDQDWLDLAHEIGLRHHSTKKNLTDGADSVPIIHFRYIPALVYPVTATLRPFLERGDHTPEEVEAMHQAWIKSVLIQSILWSHPYVHEGEF